MVFQFDDYRAYIKSCLADRLERNPSFSLRSLAREIGLAPSTLSEVLSGKKNLSPEMAELVGRNLDLQERENEYFATMVQLEVAKTESLKLKLQERLCTLNPRRRGRDLTLDIFKAIAEWHHIAILELCSAPKANVASIAKRLGLTRFSTESALERLEKLELVEKRPDGTYRKTHDDLIAKSHMPNTALRSFHTQMITKAIAAIDSQTNDKKFIGSETFAFDRRDLKKVEVILEDCFAKVVALSKKGSKRADVYHLGIQFFNLCDGEK